MAAAERRKAPTRKHAIPKGSEAHIIGGVGGGGQAPAALLLLPPGFGALTDLQLESLSNILRGGGGGGAEAQKKLSVASKCADQLR